MKVISEKEEWNQIIYQFPFWDVAHEWGYFKAFHLRDISFEPILFYFEENDYKVAYPFFKRKLNLHGDYADAAEEAYYLTAPYGYCGPLYNQVENEKGWEKFQKEFELFCQENQIQLVEEKFHPVFENEKKLLPQSDVFLRREVVVIKTDKPEELLANYQKKSVRTQIRKTMKLNVEVKIQGEESLAAFLNLYKQTMDRNEATDIYYFEDSFFKTLAAEFTSRFVLFNAYSEGEIIASLLYLYTPHCSYGFLGASDYNYRHLGANTYLAHEAYAYFYEQGILYCNEGGGRTAEADDPLLFFKKNFMSKKNNDSELKKFFYGKTEC